MTCFIVQVRNGYSLTQLLPTELPLQDIPGRLVTNPEDFHISGFYQCFPMFSHLLGRFKPSIFSKWSAAKPLGIVRIMSPDQPLGIVSRTARQFSESPVTRHKIQVGDMELPCLSCLFARGRNYFNPTC